MTDQSKPDRSETLCSIVDEYTFAHGAKPDRQDGDGLLPCPFCGTAPQFDKGEDRVRHFAEARIWCEGHECIGPATTAAFWRDAVVQWNKRAAPTRDAAEGAGEAIEPEELEILIADRSANRADDAILANYVVTRRSPSATGAAEPVAVWTVRRPVKPADQDYSADCYWEVLLPDGTWDQCVAIDAKDARETMQREWAEKEPTVFPPPVRGDREHISTIHKIIRDHLPTSSEIADARMYDAARAIASLHVQPGAGEREQK